MAGAFRTLLGKKTTIVPLVLLVLTLVILGTACSKSQDPGSQDTQAYAINLARHLTDVGAVMYGAYWCSHCANQKAMFGDAFQYVTYVECDPNGQNSNAALCTAKGIKGFPTWIINGHMYEGEQTLSQLASLTNFTGN